MRVLVCGGRYFGDVSDSRRPDFKERHDEGVFIIQTLDRFAEENSIYYTPDDNWLPTDITIISGGATGVDDRALDWAAINWTPFMLYKADWHKHGKAAGFIRNKQMLEEGKPDLVIAFPGGKGTANMVNIARKAGVEVKEISYNGSTKD